MAALRDAGVPVSGVEDIADHMTGPVTSRQWATFDLPSGITAKAIHAAVHVGRRAVAAAPVPAVDGAHVRGARGRARPRPGALRRAPRPARPVVSHPRTRARNATHTGSRRGVSTRQAGRRVTSTATSSVWSTAGPNTTPRTGVDVAVVAPPRHRDVAVRRHLIVGGVGVEPAVAGHVHREPRVRGVGADELRPRPAAAPSRCSRSRSGRAAPSDRRQPMARWAKSWHTPRRWSRTSAGGVVTSVNPGSKTKSVKMRWARSATPSCTGRPGRERRPAVGRQRVVGHHQRRVQRALAGQQGVGRGVGRQQRRHLAPDGRRRRRVGHRHLDIARRRDPQVLVRLLQREVRHQVAEAVDVGVAVVGRRAPPPRRRRARAGAASPGRAGGRSSGRS